MKHANLAMNGQRVSLSRMDAKRLQDMYAFEGCAATAYAGEGGGASQEQLQGHGRGFSTGRDAAPMLAHEKKGGAWSQDFNKVKAGEPLPVEKSHRLDHTDSSDAQDHHSDGVDPFTMPLTQAPQMHIDDSCTEATDAEESAAEGTASSAL